MSNKKRIFILSMCILLILTACTEVNSSETNISATASIPRKVGTEASDPVTPTPVAISGTPITDPIVVEQNYDQSIAVFNQKVKTTGWIRYVYQNVYFNNVTKKYLDPLLKEEWYRFDAEGKLVEAYNWVSTSTGEVQQEAFYNNGAFYNVDDNTATGGENSRPQEKNDQVDFTGNFADSLKAGENQTQEAVNYHGIETWRFSYEIEEGGIRTSEAIYINRETGLIAGKETYEVEKDGSLKLVSGTISTDFEIGVEPPIQHFQEILTKAQAQHIGPYAK